MKKLLLLVTIALVGLLILGGGGPDRGGKPDKGDEGPQGDPAILKMMEEINEELAALGATYRVNEVDAFVIPTARRLEGRILQEDLRWVPSDSRRVADGIKLTYLVDGSDGATASGLSTGATEGAIDAAMTTWDDEARCSKLPIVERRDTGADPDFVDFFLGFGGFGNPFLADITNAGWLPRGFFDALTPECTIPNCGGDFILGVSFSFIFVEFVGGPPTDINNDQYLDTALVEIYYNDNFGDPAGTRPDNPWDIDEELPAIDVETVALHENGHGLGLGHFRPPPNAVMNPAYVGIKQNLFPTDNAANCTLYGSWPNP